MGKGLSRLQLDILGVLVRHRPSEQVLGGTWIGDLPRPSDVLDALGRRHTASNFVAVSKALLRLQDRNLVTAHQGQICTQGKGYRYAASLEGEAVLRRKARVAEFKLKRERKHREHR